MAARTKRVRRLPKRDRAAVSPGFHQRDTDPDTRSLSSRPRRRAPKRPSRDGFDHVLHALGSNHSTCTSGIAVLRAACAQCPPPPPAIRHPNALFHVFVDCYDAVGWVDAGRCERARDIGQSGSTVLAEDNRVCVFVLAVEHGANSSAEEGVPYCPDVPISMAGHHFPQFPSESNPAPSPLQTITSAFSKSTTFRVLLVYTACAAVATALHVSMTCLVTGSDPRLHVFVKSRKHPFYLNGRFLFVVLAQLALAASYHLRNIMLDRFAVHWKHARPSSAKGSAWVNHLARTFQVAVVSSIFALLVFSAYVVAFGLTRTLVLPILFKVPVVSMVLRPFCAHFLRGSWTISLLPRHLGLISRTCMLGLTTIVSWEFAESLFDEKIHEPISVSRLTSDPSTSLVAGVTSLDPYYKYFAYWELDDFAKDDSAAAVSRRIAMFSDQKYSPSLWSTLVRESLLFLGKDYQCFLRRGKPAPPAAPAPAPKYKGPEMPSTPILRKPIFKSGGTRSPIAQMLNSFAADGAVTQALESSVETTATHIPEIFRA
ncbi:hypothetical protein EVG20_g10473, partial [Dentipellis fragilis]